MNKKRSNVIEINGSLYDAATGLLVSATQKTEPIKLSTAKPKQKTGASVNGFINNPSSRAQQSKKTAHKKSPIPVSTSKNTAKTESKTTSLHRQPATSIGRGARNSATLNRSGVKKPVAATVADKKIEVSPISSSASKQADKQRMDRLQHIPRSELVSRFGKTPATKVPSADIAKPIIKTEEKQSLTHHLAQTHHKTEPTLSKKEQFIKNTLAKTAIHETKKQDTARATKKQHAKRNSRIRSYATAGLVTLLITGYVAYLNIPSISMKVAANRAGFAATMPSYQPSGYSLSGPIAYSPGQVTVNFASNSDDRKFSLRQQPTTWDSDALLENYVTKQSNDYLTYQDQGLSIYIFDGTSAAWVNGQKMYIIDGSSSQLDTDQILKLATSI